MFPSADAALRHFGKQRCKDGRGVRIPSQIRFVLVMFLYDDESRYVHYYDMVIKGRSPDPVAVLLKKLVVQPVPMFDRSGYGSRVSKLDDNDLKLLAYFTDLGHRKGRFAVF